MPFPKQPLMNMKAKVGKAATVEALAEEACELGHAALKYARVLRRENPTPVRMEEAYANLVEEANDVYNMLNELDMSPNLTKMQMKAARFNARFNARKETEDGYICAKCETKLDDKDCYCRKCGADVRKRRKPSERRNK